MTITDKSLISQYEELHSSDTSYGSTSIKFIKEVCMMIDQLQPVSILDYGCGKGVLIDAPQEKYPNINCYKYDPSIPEYNTLPVDKVDMVLNTDVLEHIPENDLDDVLADIARITDQVYFNLHHEKAVTILPSGENAHCTIKTPRWYRKTISRFFPTITFLPGRRYFTSVIVTTALPFELEKKYTDYVRKNIYPSSFKGRVLYLIKSFVRNYIDEDFRIRRKSHDR